jgi:hypothetical protein
MKFTKQIFISYAHIDNQPLSPGQQGWITRFHHTFNALLSTRLGRDPEIWRDNKLGGNDVFADEIVQQFKDVALLISILSPRYIESEWCTREAREFCQQADKSGGLVVDNKSRVFKVVKIPFDSYNSLPAVFEKSLGFEFYNLGQDGPFELDPEYGETFKNEFNLKVGLLANKASELIKKLESETSNEEHTPPETHNAMATIYVAECSYDMRDYREKLIADLTLSGYAISPEQPLPIYDEAKYLSSARALLQASSLSVHLVGATPGATPDGPSQKSIGMLQNEIAAQMSKGGTLKRVIWLPANTSSGNQQHQAFIEALHHDAETQAGAVLITGGLEELKSTIYRKLKAIEQVSSSQCETTDLPEGEGKKLVYLVCDERDRKPTVELRKWLISQGMEVKLPLFAGDSTAVREANEHFLATCDAVLLYYGAGDERWKNAIDSDHRKIRAYRGTRPLLARTTYLAEPLTDDKQDKIDMEETALINGLAGFDPESMGEFLEAIRSAGLVE